MILTVEFGSHVPLAERVREAHLLATKLNCLIKFKFERGQFKYEWLTVSHLDNVGEELNSLKKAGDMAGYIYYPNIQGIADLFVKIREIELEACEQEALF